MGIIDRIFGLVFGGERNAIKETVEIFRENAEAGAQRETSVKMEALRQFATEFEQPKKSAFDRLMDALNRVPRPAMALGTLGLFAAAMIDPVWFAERMQGIALVPEPLWWLLGAVVSFYFGARHQMKGQEFQRSMAETLSRVPTVIENAKALEELNSAETGAYEGSLGTEPHKEAADDSENAALRAWGAART